MIIKLDGIFKSLSTFTSETLNGFSVITGKNGSGKSQLINLFLLKSVSSTIEKVNFDTSPEVKKIQVEGLVTDNLNVVNNASWKTLLDEHVSRYMSWGNSVKELTKELFNDDSWRFASKQNRRLFKETSLVSPERQLTLVKNVLNDLDPNFLTSNPDYSLMIFRVFNGGHIREQDALTTYLAMEVRKNF